MKNLPQFTAIAILRFTTNDTTVVSFPKIFEKDEVDVSKKFADYDSTDQSSKFLLWQFTIKIMKIYFEKDLGGFLYQFLTIY